MNEARAFHCIQKMPFKIFAFGGGTQEKRFKPLACAEVYDVLRNSWKKLPDMPKAGRYNTCVAVQNRILISSYNFILISYDIENEAYSQVITNPSNYNRYCGFRSIIYSNDRLYMIEGGQMQELDEQGRRLSTIRIGFDVGVCYQSFTSEEGIIYMLDQKAGIVYAIDPIVQKELIEVRDLFE